MSDSSDQSVDADLEFLKDRYRDFFLLGSGANGRVFSAFDKILDKPVAIKILFGINASDSQAVRFQREARLASKLAHQNIVRILDFGAGPDQRLYMVMDLVVGRTLQEVVTQDGPLSLDSALSVFIEICEALEHAHDRGVVHRDIKPGNIMLAQTDDEAPSVIVVDFGLARQEAVDFEITRAGDAFGTPLYISPEQIRTSNVDHRSDVYSFGCVMVMTLTGQPPFVGENRLATFELHLERNFDGLKGLDDQVSDRDDLRMEINRIIARCLEKDVGKRYENMSALRADLLALSGLLTDAGFADTDKERIDSVAHDQRSASRNRTGLVLLVVSLSLLMVGVTVFFFLPKTPEKVPAKAKVRLKFGQILKGRNESLLMADEAIRDADFQALENIDVKALRVPMAKVDGSGLRYIQNKPIVALDFSMTDINDKNLEYIGRMKRLRHLWLNDTHITDKGIKNILGANRLEWLYLRECKGVSDIGLADIATAFPDLTWLEIGNTSIGQDGMKFVTKLSRLQSLGVGSLGLSDSSMPDLTVLPLEFLNLSGNEALTDRSLVLLAEKKGLKALRIAGCTGLTSTGIARLRKNCPSLTVDVEEGPLDDVILGEDLKRIARDELKDR